ncbi:MAG: bifunctional phosphoglucose/phosphomannose isomerase [Candidatus Brennerbacteria bacterium]|nr:bifunctional phosphoglucose/phosphomannose isomerase [Candidatus Brennerbacteria bacterium]
MIYEDIKNFSKQFEWRPKIENGEPGGFQKFIVVGMGGSNLAADLVKILRPDLDIAVHRDYGLPKYLDEDTLVILSSYSGNTEETLDAYEEAGRRGLPRIAVGAGGKLLELAKNDGVPHIKFPESNIQPRVALGWSLLALLKIIGDEKLLEESATLAEKIKPEIQEEQGKKLAEDLKNSTPIVYASHRNKGLSYFWKVSFNETAKTPAFANVLPEQNHNELSGFENTEKFFFLFINDGNDNPRILKRMEVLKNLYNRRGFKLQVLELQGSPLERVFSSVLLANWTAFYLAEGRGVDPDTNPSVEEFKKLIQ